MAASDARPIPRKNTAYRVTFPILDADGDLVTGAAGLDSEYSGDGGTFTDLADEATEIATASGMYYLDLTAGEMNYDTVAIIVKTSTSGAKTTVIVMYPEEAGDMRAAVTSIGNDVITAASIAADAVTEIQAGLATAANVSALNNLSAAQVNAEVVDVLRTDTIPDSVPADGSAAAIAQAIYMIWQYLSEKAVSGTTVTVKKPDGSTSLLTLTMDSATDPTTITRSA